jgi:hypothetical protein
MSDHSFAYKPRRRSGKRGADNLSDSARKEQETTITQASEHSAHESTNDKHVVYTPSVDEVRKYYDPSIAGRFKTFFSNPKRRNEDYAELSEEINAEFDRMLETVRHDAWEEGHETGISDETVLATPLGVLYGVTPNPYEKYETKETE